MAEKPIFERILLKLSGEALMGDRAFGTDPERVKAIASQIKHVHEDKHESKTLDQLRTEIAASTGENVVIRRFARFQVGEE